MRLLLDTCTFLWLADEESRLSVASRSAICESENELFLSAASAWEIAIKYRIGRLPLAERPGRLLPRVREYYGVSSLAVDEQSAAHTERLSLLHRDPFDRLLVAQAIVHDLVIVTPDPAITAYPARSLW